MNRYKTARNEKKNQKRHRENTQNDSVGFASFAYVWRSENEKMFRFYGDNKRDFFVIEPWSNGKKRKQRQKNWEKKALQIYCAPSVTDSHQM